jgi:hypothetical protein
MILHAASIAAFFVDQLTQAPVQIQCVQQSTTESWLKWLLPTIVQTVIGLSSITAAVVISVRSFRRNREAEHEQWLRNQKAGHEQWVRDQKKAEWGTILSYLTVADVKLPHVFDNSKWPTMCDGMLQDLRNVLPAMRNTIFIADVLDNDKVIDSFKVFVNDAAEKIEKIKNANESFDNSTGTAKYLAGMTGGEISAQDAEIELQLKSKYFDDRKNTYHELFDRFHEQAAKIRKVALDSLLSD